MTIGNEGNEGITVMRVMMEEGNEVMKVKQGNGQGILERNE